MAMFFSFLYFVKNIVRHFIVAIFIFHPDSLCYFMVNVIILFKKKKVQSDVLIMVKGRLAHVSLPLKSFLFAVLDASILPHQAWGGVVWEERQP